MLKKNKKFVWVVVLVLLAIIVGGFFVISNNGVEGQTVVVTRGNIDQQVSVTGTLKPVDEVDLAFERGGKVGEVLADIGDQVTAGQVLAALDNRDAAIELEKAKVSYQDLVNVDPLDVTKAENKVKTAEADLASSYDSTRSALSAESKALNDVVNGLDDDVFNKNNYLSSINFTFGKIAEERRNQAEASFYQAQQALKNFLKIYQINFSSSDPVVIESTVTELYKVATECAQAVKEAKDIITYLKEREYGDQDKAATAYAAISDLAVSANGAVDNIFAVKELIANNKRSLDEAKLDLADIKDGPDMTDVSTKKLAIALAEKDYSDYFLRSPIAGVVTKQDAKVGEQAVSGAVLISVISADKMQIEANVPEVDIAKVVAGYLVDITFDAFPDEHFSGRVIMVDPAQTVIDGVVNFKVTIALDSISDKLKSGLTANVTIKSTLAQNVLLIPRAALIDHDGTYFVKIVNGRQITEREVQTGVFGQIGNVEVIGGLNEGEAVLIGQ